MIIKYTDYRAAAQLCRLQMNNLWVITKGILRRINVKVLKKLGDRESCFALFECECCYELVVAPV